MNKVVELKPGEPLACPNKSMTQWNSHPRVFMHADADGNASCPYCGTKYHQQGAPAHH